MHEISRPTETIVFGFCYLVLKVLGFVFHDAEVDLSGQQVTIALTVNRLTVDGCRESVGLQI